MPIEFKPKKASNIAFTPKVKAQPELPGQTESALSGVVQGATLGFADEMEALLGAAGAKYLHEDPREFSDIKADKLRKAREFYSNVKSANPIAYQAGEIAGLVGSPVSKIVPGGMVTKGAIEGGLYGAGVSEKAAPKELAVDIAKGAAVGAALPIALKAGQAVVTGSQSVAARLRQKLNNATPEQLVNDSAVKFLGVGGKRAGKIAEDNPDLGKTLLDEGIVDTIIGTPTRYFNNAKAVKTNIGQEISNVYSSLQTPISPAEIAARLRMSADSLAISPKAEASSNVIAKLRSIAGQYESRQAPLSPKEAFEARAYWDDIAFNNSGLKPNAPLNNNTKVAAENTREVFKQALDERVLNELGPNNFDNFNKLNERYSNVSKVTELLQDSRFENKAGLMDRLTIGAVMAGASNPIVSGAFFGGRELYKTFGGRAQFMQPKKSSFGPLAARVGRAGIITSEQE